jgi:hypothetical protein
LVNKTPHEAWTGKKSSLKHLRVYGFDAYVHVLEENRSKLDNNTEKCIVIGYKYRIKGYKLWNPITKKTIYNWDVAFREIKDVSKHEFLQGEKKLEKIEFELKDEESN